MINIQLRTLALLLVALTFTANAQQPSRSDQQPATSGSLTGTVVADGQAVSGAAVFIRRINSAQGRSVTTNDQGRFEITNLESGLYSVVPAVPAFVTTPREPDTPAPLYRPGDSVNLELIKGAVITGTVTNAAAEPVVGARVRAIMVRDSAGRELKSFPPMGQGLTDDRGIYRIYGLIAGSYIIEVGGPTNVGTSVISPFDMDAPTFAPSSTRETATASTVMAGQEVTMDVRYRGEQGRIISGTVKSVTSARANVALTSAENGWMPVATSLQSQGSDGFSFYGIADGVYDLVAQENLQVPGTNSSELLLSDPKRIEVKGADIRGVELITKPLAWISGKIVLEPSSLPDCKDKRRPDLTEVLVTIQRNRKDNEPAAFLRPGSLPSLPDKDGSVAWRNLVSGQYTFNPRFYARYWYLDSITFTSVGAPSAKSALTNVKTDAARNWTTLKPGDRIKGLTITLAEGAASIRGALAAGEGVSVPAGLNVFVIPAEREKIEDVLRYFSVAVMPDRTFAFDNLPPGRYWIFTQAPSGPVLSSTNKLRLPDSAEIRTKLRRSAEAVHDEVELKPCQTITGFQIKL